MNPHDRRIRESPLFQGEDEEIVYCLTTTPWGSTPTNVSVVVKDVDGTDVTSSVTSGISAVSGDVISTPTIQDLTANTEYRLEIRFTVSGNVMEAWAIIDTQE